MKLFFKILTLAFLAASGNSVFAQSLTPMIIGTIAPGDSVVIYYDVTINTGAGAQVSNQGTITGSNFVTFNTDDPDTGPLGDPTITPLNVFPLPVTLYSLSAVQRGSEVEVAWKVASESNMLKYDVEKSFDGRNFSRIGEVAALNNGQSTRYSFLDAVAGNGSVYYRLKLVDRSAAGRYSPVVKVDFSGKAGSVTVFPNPAAQKQITVQLSNVGRGMYKLELYNGAGQPVYSQSLRHDGGALSRGLTLPATLSPGTYYVKILAGEMTYVQPLMIK